MLILSLVLTVSAEPAGRPLTHSEIVALKEPIDIGRKVYSALGRYYENTERRPYPAGPALLTASPTLDLLHTLRYIDDSDMRTAEKYRIGIPPVVFKSTDAVLTMKTKYGELSFDTRGEITLEPSR